MSEMRRIMGASFGYPEGPVGFESRRPDRALRRQRLRLESLPRPELLPDSRLLLPLLLLLREDDPSSLLPPRWRLLSESLRDEPLPLRDELLPEPVLLPEPDDLLD